ncbi:cysteine--tRNA ligase [Candidatus Peregrinibacteria bacterium]|nr:cysteine--tRNA ligase [Candidatus Peregrinibacteria bacterium]
MKIYNSLSRQKEDFVSINEDLVKMYVCGPTVYDHAHIGHGRVAVVFDVIRKYLEYKGYKVLFASNYTDIDDKMINKAKEMQISVTSLADMMIKEYENDMKLLKVKEPTYKPFATEYIETMIEMVQALLSHDIAYVLDDGIYFDLKKYPDYGKLTCQNLEDLKPESRVKVAEGKRNSGDFVLWKFEKPDEPSWEAPFGKGRPGWHIECSAMVKKIFDGATIDIHGGGEDLKFPHHDCEIAQSEAFDNKTYVKYWMHNAFVMVDSQKMSKSLGNFSTLKDTFKEFEPEIVRFYYLQNKYRDPMDFHADALIQAKNTLAKIHNFYFDLSDYTSFNGKLNSDVEYEVNTMIENFEKNMDDDFNTVHFLADFYDFIKYVNKKIRLEDLSNIDVEYIKSNLRKIDKVLCFIIPPKKKLDLQIDIEKLIEERDNARNQKNFQLADQIRDDLLNKYSIQLIDKPGEKTTWRMI